MYWIFVDTMLSVFVYDVVYLVVIVFVFLFSVSGFILTETSLFSIKVLVWIHATAINISVYVDLFSKFNSVFVYLLSNSKLFVLTSLSIISGQ
jgi:hypothetical protein